MIRKGILTGLVTLCVGLAATEGQAADPEKHAGASAPIAWAVTCQIGPKTFEIVVEEQRHIGKAVMKCRDFGGHVAGVTPIFKEKK